ncbi:hypothetical protein BJ085DRAFT_25018 [Dimargaris cristalligena]|uniref:RRM domain-containing protein n=1 Tax=Dimargaris cristalligena TaxID=215637 RepID=A0A4P9ZQ21_9FUNG|nr:hypothetical protein BJ085DRAFT_25018 [Dimargaris cristalligena]|eukprot:RKP35298.1 hypothetical protein BJ085DRAFT_25018 [Dimargaris cristalligena]
MYTNAKSNLRPRLPSTLCTVATEPAKVVEETPQPSKKEEVVVAEPIQTETEEVEAQIREQFMNDSSSDNDESEPEVQEDAEAIDAFKDLDDKIELDATASLEKSSTTSGSKSQGSSERGTIYVGRLPKGFEEEAMRNYFRQFGDITGCSAARNPKTQAFRHYGFVQFEHKEVAAIAAATMNNYLLEGHSLVCNVVEPQKAAKMVFHPYRKREAAELAIINQRVHLKQKKVS